MTGNSGNNTPENQEQAKKNQSRDLVREFVPPFIEAKLKSDTGVEFYNRIKETSGDVMTEFLDYWSSRDEWNNLTKEEKETVRSFEKSLFLREIVRTGAGLESKRSALLHIIGRDYDFSPQDFAKVESEVEDQRLWDLASLLQSGNLREKLLKRLFPGENLPYREWEQKIDFVFSGSRLDEKQRASIRALLEKSYVDESDVAGALDIFSDPTDRKLLVKMFLPTITLGQLKKEGILSESQVRTAISDSILQGDLAAGFSSLDEQERKKIAAQIDPEDIVIETMLFPDDVVSIILNWPGKEYIAKELTRNNEDFNKALEAENDIRLKPTKEGLFYPSFIDHLKKLNVKNAGDFVPGSVIKGKTVNQYGETVHFAYRIDAIEDDVEKNNETKGNGRVISLTDVLLPDGTLHLAKKKSESPEFTYSEMSHILKSASGKESSLEIITDENLKTLISTGKERESLYEADIKNLGDLNRALDSIDEKGARYPLTESGGVSVQVGEPGKQGYWVYQITSINTRNGTIELNNGQNSEILDFVRFFTAFKTQKATRLPVMNDMEGLLSAMGTHGMKGSAYSKLSMDGGKIAPDDRMGDKEFPGVTEFGGKKKYIKLLDFKNAGHVEFLVYDDFDEKLGLEEQKKSPTKYMGSYHLLYNFLNQEAYTPKVKEKEMKAPEGVDHHKHYHKGSIKAWLGNPSLHDIFKGAKDLVGFFKHHLEHGTQVQSAKMQLALGEKLKWLGMDDGMIRELRAKVYSGNKKLMTELVDSIKGMPSKERHAEVEHILLNKGSHDYEIHAVAIAMLQKHGNLYAGGMKAYQGSFLYFERMTGVKYSPNLQIGTGDDAFKVQDTVKNCQSSGEPFSEELLLQSYLKWLGSDKGGYRVDGGLWLELKKGWKNGIDEEEAAGKRETSQFQTTKGRTSYVMGKLKDAEYAHGLGGLDDIWGKGGTPHEMHLPAIVLALSSIPSNLHQGQLNALKGKFLSGHPYTALLFLGTPEDQNLFRSVVKKLCEDDGEMSGAYKKIEALQKSDPKKELTGEIINFWEKYGSVLNDRLNVTQDGTLVHLARTDRNCERYLRTCNSMYTNMDKLHPDEIGNEVFEHEGSSFLGLNSDHYLKFIKVNPAQSILDLGDDTTARLFSGFKDGVGAIKSMKVATSEDTEDMQKTLYLQYHRAFMKFLADKFPHEPYGRIQNQVFFKEMESKYGMSLVPYGLSLDSAEYKQHAEGDFEAYKRWGRGVSSEKVNVVGSVESLLKQTGYAGSRAANDDSARRANAA